MTRIDGPASPGPVGAFSWLDWTREGDEYVGGEYRIRLVGPACWEVLLRNEHIQFDDRLSSALARAGHHHIEAVRRRDMVKWSLVMVGSLLAVLFVAAIDPDQGVTLVVGGIASILGLTGFARFSGAATRNLYDPYRRRAPWEPRDWWHRDSLGSDSIQ